MKPIDRRKLPTVIANARNSNHPAAIGLQGGDARKRMTPETREEVLTKVAAGMTVRQAAVDTGLSPGMVHQRCLDDPEFADRLTRAREHGAETLADTVLDVALDPDMPAAQKNVIIDALKWLAKVNSRGRFGDKVELGGSIAIQPVVLPTIAVQPIALADFTETDLAEYREASDEGSIEEDK